MRGKEKAEMTQISGLGQWVDGGDINWEKKYKKRKCVGLNNFSFAPNFGMRHLENGQVDVSSRQ